MINSIPPQGLVLLSIVAIQVGAAVAIHLFPVLGASGTVAVRIIFSAILLGLAARTGLRTLVQTFRLHWKLLVVFGLSIAAMNLFFYQALARIPLGAAVAFEFIGPLGVAALASRRLTQFAWIALAALGIVLLSPLSGADLDPIGILFALMAGTGWACFIIFAGRVGKLIPGNDGLAIGMAVAALAMIPFALPVAGILVTNPLILLASIGVALLSTTIPFTFEFTALKRLPARTYGVLVSLEPGVAALVGALLLGERIGLQGMIAITCVIIAAIGITLSDARTPP
ncbi:EamA family transporter [Granulosicoccus antarcticus]|uniref:Threonine/homoserine exporter RhtA n=1 Tax=Granulosicoccus antarcticus IMCC3135 TaxID=1192854 RepID=A0A2Z2NWK2_9GAMM|nr:EamA family transporter [Granulosicoccus antarcticus]ASJ74108.1 Threonine/homoserine exporter RhtA [Granulosicoccus antarcticus IMCC3135]